MPKVQTEFLEDRQAKLTVTVDPEQVQREMKAAARRIASQVNIPGFRRGKAPYHIIVRYYGEDAIFEEALEDIGQSAYGEALEESGLEPYAPGALTDLQRDPLVLTFTLPLAPEVDLGDYRDIRIPYEADEVTDKDVVEALEELRDQQATLDPVEQPIEMGNVALLNITGTWVRDPEAGAESSEDGDEDSSVWLDREEVRVKIAEDATYPVPGFPERVVGMAAGEERSFEISFPEDGDEMPEAVLGKTLHFEVKCQEVYAYNAPELDDEFARQEGDHENLEALRADVRARLQRASDRLLRNKYVDKVLDHLLESVVKLSYPPVIVEAEIDDLVDDFESQIRQQGLTLEDYQKLSNVTGQKMRDDMRETAVKRVERMLVLGEIAQAEQLGVSDAEIMDEIETAVLSYGSSATLARELFSGPEFKRRIANRLLAEKTVNQLIAIAKGEEPPLGEPEAPVAEETTTNAEASPAAEVGAEAVATPADEAATESAADEEAIAEQTADAAAATEERNTSDSVEE